MIPLHLTLSGFLSYRDPVEIDFTSFDLACIAGPNGAGKSSLLDAITWALFGIARRSDELIINAQSKEANVSLTFSYEGNVYRVQRIKPREKSTILEFQIQQTPDSQGSNPTWKPLSERTLRETQARHRVHAAPRLRDLRQRLLLSAGQSRPVHPAAPGRPQAHPEQHPGFGNVGGLPQARRRTAQAGGGRDRAPGRAPSRDPK